MKKVFISYAREDREVAERLCRDFKEAGLDPWLDSEKLLPGQNWRHEVKKAIKESAYFVALLSSNSISKVGYVQKELKIAVEILDRHPASHIFLIPVRLDECRPEDERLQYIHWADLFPNYESGFGKVLQVIAPDTGAQLAPVKEKPLKAQKPQNEKKLKSSKTPDEITKIRHEPFEVRRAEAQKTFRLNKNWRPLEYTKNQYEDKGDGTVSDHATGLMWQQSGSDNFMSFKDAKEYIDDLNKQKFAGYKDWRLPTIDELISLLEPEKKSNGLFIQPVFDRKQEWCWSSDRIQDSPGRAWYVGFSSGRVSPGGLSYGSYYVRGVRS